MSQVVEVKVGYMDKARAYLAKRGERATRDLPAFEEELPATGSKAGPVILAGHCRDCGWYRPGKPRGAFGFCWKKGRGRFPGEIRCSIFIKEGREA